MGGPDDDEARGQAPVESESTFSVTAVAAKDGATTVSVGGLASRSEDGTTERADVPGPRVVVSPDGVFAAGDGACTYDPPLPLVRGRPRAGDSWTWSGKFIGGLTLSESRTTAGLEAVETPAGRFEAVRVEITHKFTGGQKWEAKSTEWYAPGVGLVRSRSKGMDRELMSFTPAPPPPAKK